MLYGEASWEIHADAVHCGRIGYQFGFQSANGVDFKTQYLHIGVAFGAMFE